jgi:PadR family transcriptional regulator, regulatory protein PadR
MAKSLPLTPGGAPLSEAAYLVLASLADGPTHGYEIIGRANALSDGRVTLAVATLYGTLDRLTLRRHIELLSEEIVDGRARRTYSLTDEGKDILDEETQRMAQLVGAVAKHARSKGLRVAAVTA